MLRLQQERLEAPISARLSFSPVADRRHSRLADEACQQAGFLLLLVALVKGSTEGQTGRAKGGATLRRQSAAVRRLSLIVCLCWISLQGAF